MKILFTLLACALLICCEQQANMQHPLIVKSISCEKSCVGSKAVTLVDTLGNSYELDCTHTLAIAVSHNNKEGDTLW